MMTLTKCPLPVISAVNGFAVGIGTTMLLHCDLVYASKNSLFMMPFINLGLVPEFASSQLLQKRTGYLKAVEMLMLGEKFSAEIALDYKLINQICEENELIPVALNTAVKVFYFCSGRGCWPVDPVQNIEIWSILDMCRL